MPSIPCIGAYTLPRQPRRVSLLHHAIEGVAIVAVSYVSELGSGEHGHMTSIHPLTQNYITLLEFALTDSGALPNTLRRMGDEEALVSGAAASMNPTAAAAHVVPSPSVSPRRIRHITLPSDEAVTALTLSSRGHHGDVYLTVQCRCASQSNASLHDEAAHVTAGTMICATRTRLYRRVREEVSETMDYTGHDAPHDGRVDYEPMPRTLEMNTTSSLVSSVVPWSCLTALPVRWGGGEHLAEAKHGEADDALLIAAGSYPQSLALSAQHANRMNNRNGDNYNKYNNNRAEEGSGCMCVGEAVAVVQLIQIGRTRALLRQSAALPALSPFAARAVAALRGSPTRVILLCHNALVEVAWSHAEAEPSRGEATSVAHIHRVWRWSPHDPLTSCCVGEPLLYAGTAHGAVIVWDMREDSLAPTAVGAADACIAITPPLAVVRSSDPVVQKARHRCQRAGAGAMYAHDAAAMQMPMPRAMGVRSPCDAWGPNEEEEADDMQAITGMYSPAAGELVTCAEDGSVVVWRCRQRAAGSVYAEDAGWKCGDDTQTVLLPVACDEAVCGEGSGWTDMSGAENLVAVVGECGELRVYSVY